MGWPPVRRRSLRRISQLKYRVMMAAWAGGMLPVRAFVRSSRSFNRTSMLGSVPELISMCRKYRTRVDCGSSLRVWWLTGFLPWAMSRRVRSMGSWRSHRVAERGSRAVRRCSRRGASSGWIWPVVSERTSPNRSSRRHRPQCEPVRCCSLPQVAHPNLEGTPAHAAHTTRPSGDRNARTLVCAQAGHAEAFQRSLV
ncbi:hypothetical protein ACFFX0_32445 [Citricoccus parietis]|uniref:Uncharacterized protein n=1 Tax=Citricoccus parietis TaxID=592307 RepID=A0ABV5G9R0_9MICC